MPPPCHAPRNFRFTVLPVKFPMAPLVRTALISLLLFFVTVCFSILLSSRMLENLATTSLLSMYESVEQQATAYIGHTLDSGRTPASPKELESRLKNTLESARGLEGFLVCDTQGTFLVTVSKAPLSDARHILETALHPGKTINGWVLSGTLYLRAHPLLDKNKRAKGYLVTLVSHEAVTATYKSFMRTVLILFGIMALGVCVAQTGWMGFFATLHRETEYRRKALRRTLLFFVGGAQTLFVILMLVFFSSAMHEALREKALIAGQLFAQEPGFPASKYLWPESATKIHDRLKAILDRNQEISRVELLFEGSQIASFGPPVSADNPAVRVPVYAYPRNTNTPRIVVAAIRLWPNTAYAGAQLKRLALDLGTTLIISFLLLYELSGFVSAVGLKKRHMVSIPETVKQYLLNITGEKTASQQAQSELTAADTRNDISYALAQDLCVQPQEKSDNNSIRTTVLRGIIFLFFFGYDMVLSFVPLAASTLPGTLPFLDTSLHSALPISTEAAAAGIGVLATGAFNTRFGWRVLLRFGICAAVVGALCAATTHHIAWFVLARAFSGLGFGITLMTAQISILETEKKQVSGLASLYAGVFAGSMCGSAAGGMAADLFGYLWVFGASACLVAVPLIIFPLLPKPLPLPHTTRPAQPNNRWTGLARLFRSRGFLAPILLVSIPAAMSLTGFLYLTVPTQLQKMCVSQADIGRIFMLYGLCFVVIGPLLAKLTDKRNSQRVPVFCTGLAAGLGLLLVKTMPGYWGYAGAVLFMGISQSLLASSMLVYILGLPYAAGLDKGTVGSACRMLERGGQIFGPLVFGTVLTRIGSDSLFLWFGILYCAGSLIFLVSSFKITILR